MLSRGSNCGFTVKNNGDLAGILGLCIPELDGKMSYMIAVTGDNSADIEKYDVITLASSKYMVFEAQGAVPKSSSTKMEEVHHYIHQYQADTVKSAPFLSCIRMVILQVKNILQKFGCLLNGD